MSRWLVAVLMVFVFASPSATWRWSNPTPHGANIFDVTSRGSLVVQVGEAGQVYTSDDLDEWAPRNTGVQNSLRSALFFGPRLVITASSGVILYSDTIDKYTPVNLGTADWIEGIASSGSRLIAVGDNCAIYTSVDGAAWQREAVTGDWLTSVGYGNGKFVAVGYTGYTISSADGLSWTPGIRISPQDLNKVAWLADRFWAIGNSGAAFTSVNGTTWTSLNVGTTNDLFGITFDGSEITLVGRSELRTSVAPFTTWVSKTGPAPAPPPWTYFTAWYDGAETVVAGRSGMFLEGFHETGNQTNSWLVDSDAPRNWIWSLTRVGDLFVASGDSGGIFSSTDGYRFDQEVVPTSASSAVLEGIGGTTNVLVAVGSAGTILYSQASYTNVVSTNSTGQLVTNQVSLLGVNWQTATSPTLNELQGVGVLGNTFIISGGNGTILTGTDGNNWTLRLSGSTRMLSSVAASAGRAVISGDRGTILTSDNATAWTARTSGVTNWIYQVRYLNGQFVAVGETGVILTSPDGATWTKRTSPTTKWLNAVTYANGSYLAGGTSGTLLTSPDAITWSVAPYNNTKSIYGFAVDDNRVYAAGLEGAALRARLTPWPAPVTFLSFTQTNNADIFLIDGELDQRFHMQRTVDFKSWFDGMDLEVTDNSGVYLFFQGTVRGNNWFFRSSNLNP